MLSFGGALHWVRETGAQYFGPILDDLRYDFELRKPQRERQRNEDEFNEAISAEKDPRNKEDLISEGFHFRDEIQDKIEKLQTQYLRQKAEAYCLQVPEFDPKSPAWVESKASFGWRLTRAAQMELRTAINAEKTARRQFWTQIVVPVLSVVVAIVALLAKR